MGWEGGGDGGRGMEGGREEGGRRGREGKAEPSPRGLNNDYDMEQ